MTEKTLKEQEATKNSALMERIIFDPDKIWKTQPFVFSRLNKDTIGIGLLLPENVTRTSKTGHSWTEQIWRPNIITSDGTLIPVNKNLGEDYKIIIRSIPNKEELPVKWPPKSLDKYLKGQEPDLKHDLKTVFNIIAKEHEKYYFDRNTTWHKVQALWDIGTYYCQLFNFYPLMNLVGHKGSGKTTKIMRVSRMFSWNATKEIGNITEASLFRLTDATRPTKYIDETEDIWKYDPRTKTYMHDSRAELLNSSVQKGSIVNRTEARGKKWEVIPYYVYSPTMIGSTNGLRGATEDRAITRICVKTTTDPRAEEEVNIDDPMYEEMRGYLYLNLMQNWKKVEKEYLNFENNTKLKARDFNIWKPLLVLAKIIDSELYEEIKKHAEKITKIKSHDNIAEESFEYRIIKATTTLLEQNDSWVYLKHIAQGVDPYKPPYSQTIAKILDGLGLREYKEHSKEGNGYRISSQEFKEIINSTYPQLDLSSISSISSGSKTTEEKIKVNISEDKKDLVKLNREHNEHNEDSEAKKRGLVVSGSKEKMIENVILEDLKNQPKNEREAQHYIIMFPQHREITDKVIARLGKRGEIYEKKPGILRLLN